ncbi:calcineurin-like phosphoesterase [Vibrio phage 1.081.O._10N.286.52.C2]|nr:calcineurin-like phosphoesterase [Vibrio phage 1.081.O._10N.286.52.C2]
MKVAFIGDTHIGIRDDDLWIQAYQKKFFEFCFAEMEARGVDKIVQTGDWFDVRRGLSQDTLKFQREVLNPMFNKYETHVLVGNHDAHLRESLTPNSCTEVLGQHGYYVIHQSPSTVDFDGVKLDIIPWICKENEAEVAEFIENSTSEYCVGHFELNGFEFHKGQKATGCLDSGFLKGYKQVWSGHFHTQSDAGNIRYLGTPYTLTLGDADDKRGFWIFDTETHEMEFIENPDCWHTKMYFDAATFDTKTIDSYANKNVKIIVERRSCDTRKISFDVVEDRIASIAHACQTLDELDIISDVSNDVKSIKDINEYVADYADTLEESTEVREKIKVIFAALRNEALENA